MITKLPIIIDNNNYAKGFKSSAKIIYHNFSIKRNNDQLILDIINPYNTMDHIKLPCVNKLNCIYYLKVTLPLVFTVYNSKIISPYFFISAIKSKEINELDFFYSLLNFLNKNSKINYKLLGINDLINCKDYLFKYYNSFKLKEEYDNISLFLSELFIYINVNLSIGLMINYLYPNYTNKSFKLMFNKKNLSLNKILGVCNSIKSYKFSYKMSDYYCINEHLNNFKNKIVPTSILKKGKYYFLVVNDNKLLRIYINEIKNKTIYFNDNIEVPINKYKLYYYHNCFDNFLNKDFLFNFIISDDLFNVFINKIFSKSKLVYYSEICNYFFKNNNNILTNIEKLDIKFKNIEIKFKNFLSDKHIIKNNDINSNIFLSLVNKYSIDLENNLFILNILFAEYSFPIKYNKRELDNIFEKIIYFSLLNYEKILVVDENKFYINELVLNIVPIKLKNLYFNIMKIYYNFIVNNKIDDIIYNYKIYNDFIHYEVFKTIFESSDIITNLFKFKLNLFNKVISVFKNLDVLSHLSRNIKWKNLSKKLYYLEILIDNKEILFYLDKPNKTILPENFDSRIRKIIFNPYEMFKYLKNESDFIKWIYFLDHRLIDLYNTTINILESDYINLGRLIYLLVNIKEQKLEDESYIKFINFCKRNEKLILYNSRINLKIKDKLRFININLNLGYLAKHLTWDQNVKITLSSYNDFENNKLKDKIKNISKKYYKYKGKYLRLKKDTSSIEYYTKSSKNDISTNIEI